VLGYLRQIYANHSPEFIYYYNAKL
jgi:hypothetical protein